MYYVSIFNPFTPKSELIDFTMSNARQFYSCKSINEVFTVRVSLL